MSAVACRKQLSLVDLSAHAKKKLTIGYIKGLFIRVVGGLA